MDLEIARLANVSRLLMTDRQMIAIRSALFTHSNARIEPGVGLDAKSRHLPMLDWPTTLFQDEEGHP